MFNDGKGGRKEYPAELAEIARMLLSGRKPITREEINNFLIDLYLYEKTLKKNKSNPKKRKKSSARKLTCQRKS